MPIRRGGGGGGGGGLHFREPPDIFTGSTLAIAQAARSTYFTTTDTTAYLQFIADRSLAIIIRVTGADDAFETYLGPIGGVYDDTMWEDRTDAVQGPQGFQGRFVISEHINASATPSPAIPTGGSYDIDTGVLTPSTGATILPTVPSVGEDVYIAEAIINPRTDTSPVTPAWGAWVERAHLTSGISHVEHTTDLTGTGIASDPLGLTTPFTAADQTKLTALTEDVAHTTDLTGAGTVASPLGITTAFTVAEQTKLGLLERVFDLGGSPSQTGGVFTFAEPPGYVSGSWPATGALVQFEIGTIANPDISDTIIQVGSDVYLLQGLEGQALPLEELRPDTQYIALGKDINLVLIGPTDLVDDDVIDVTRMGLPLLDADNYKKFFIDHDTPRVWVGHREIIDAMPATATWGGYVARSGLYLGASSSAPHTVSAVRFYYNTSAHVWRQGTRINGVDQYVNTPFQSLPGNDTDDIWLGEQPDDATTSELVAPFDATHRYHYYNQGTTTVRTMNNSTYVGSSTAFAHYVAEPISAPTGVSALTGLTSGGGITLDGAEGTVTSGVIGLSINTGLAAFPTIPIAKGGTGATDASGARTNFGLGTAATVDVGITSGDLPTLGTAGVFSPDRLAASGTDAYVLAYQTGGAMAWVAQSVGLTQVAHDISLSGLGTTGSPLTVVGTTNVVADSSTYASDIIDLTVTALPSISEILNGNIVSFQIPSGIPGDTTQISVRVNGQAIRGFYDHAGNRIIGSQLTSVGNWITGQRILTRIYVLGDLGVVVPSGTSDGNVSGVDLSLSGNILTVAVQSTLGGPFSDTQDFSGIVGTQGTPGPQGAFPIFIFRNSLTTPPTPTGGDYVLTTGVLTAPTNWTTLPTTPGVGEDTYVARFQVNPQIHTGTIIPTWSAPYEEAGSGLVSVAHDTAFTGDGTSANPLALAVTGADFPTITLAKGGLGAAHINVSEIRTTLGLSTAVTEISETGGVLTIDYADGTDFTVPLEEGGSFRGEGHEVFQSGDTFLTTPSGTRFEFGDYAIVDDILYIYNQGVERTGVQPTNIATQTNFTELPRVLPNPTGTATGPVTQLGIGDAIYSVADPLTANFETLTNMSVGSISPSDIFFFRDINVDMNRKLTIGNLRQYLDDVIDVTGAGLPTLTAGNYRKIFIDHDTPRVWVGHREVRAATGAQGTFVGHTNANYHGVHSGNGPIVPQSANQYYYNRSFQAWFVTYLFNTMYVWASGSFADIFGATARWLGEQPDAATAVGLIQNFDTNNIYIYYRNDIAFRTIEVLTNNTYQAALTEETHYTSEPLGTGFGTSGLTGVLTAATSGLMGGATSGDANLSLDLSGLTTILGSAVADQNDRLYIEDDSVSTLNRRSITPKELMESFNLERLTNMAVTSISNTDIFFFRDINPGENRKIRIDTVADYFVGGTSSALTQASGRMTVRAGGINELHLDGTNDPTTGQVLSSAGSNQFTWIDATGGGTDTNDYATAGTFDITSGQLSLEIRGTSGFTTFTVPAITLPAGGGGVDTNEYVDTAALTLSALDLTLTLGRTGLLSNVVSTALALPDPLAANIETLTNMSSSSIAGTHDIFFFRDESDTSANPNRKLTIQTLADFMSTGTTLSATNGVLSVAAAGILRANLSRPLQAYFDTAPGVIYNTATGLLDFQFTAAYGPEALDGDTYIFGAPASISSASTNLSLRINSSATSYPLRGTDKARIVESDLTSTQKYVVTFVTDQWVLTAGLADANTNNYVDTAALTLNATNQLVATIGRTGSLADIVTTPLTLPAGGTVTTVSAVANGGITVAQTGSDYALSVSDYANLNAWHYFLPSPAAIDTNRVIDLGAPVSYNAEKTGDTYTFFGPQVTGTGFARIRINSMMPIHDLVNGDNTATQVQQLVELAVYVVEFDAGLDAYHITNTPLNIHTTATSGLTSTVAGGAATLAINADRLTAFSDAVVATDDELILYNESTSSTERVTVANIAAAIGTAAGVSSVTSADSNIAVSPTTGDARLTLADQVNAWTWYNIGVADFTANLITIEAPSSYNAEKRGDFYSFHLNISGDPTGDVSIRRSSSATTWPLRDGGARRVQAEDLSRSLYQVIFNGSDAYYVTNYPQEFEFPDNGNARQFIIAQSDVGGTVDAITISTGEDITLQNGDEFYFISPGVNAGDVTITVDSNATFELVKSDGLGTRIQMGVGDMRQHGHDLIRYTEGFADEFVWLSAIQGTAAASNVGILAGNLVALNSSAVIDADRLGTGGTAGEVLTWASGTATWGAQTGGTDTGNQRSYVVPDSGVTGTVDAIILTTGVAISLEDGDELYFTPVAGNTGPVTIAVDGNPAIDMVVYRNQGLRALKVGNLINAPAFIIYQESDNRFLWRPAAGSTAQYYEVGTGNFDIAILGPQGLFDPNRLGSGTTPTAGQYLAWASAGAVWIDLPAAGTGTITGITTATGSGLAGGALTGTPSLSLDFNNLTALTTSTIDTLDEFVLEDVSEAATPYRKMNLGNLVAHIAGPTGSGLTSADGQLSLVDEGILEPKLSVTNGPTTGQFLTAAASGRFTWVNAPVTVTVRGTRRQWFVADTDVVGAGNNITLNPQDAALTALQDGDTFVFRPNDDIGTSNSVNVLIRQTSPAKTVQRSNGAGGFTNVVIGDWTIGDLVVLQYSSGLDRLVWLGGMTGTASTRNTGTASGEVAVLNSGGTFDPARLSSDTPATNDVLTYNGTSSVWAPAAGGGDITSIITPATGGITGGMTSGDVTLELDINGLPTFGSVGAAHFIPVLFPSDNGKVTVTVLSTALNTILSLNANRITAGELNVGRLSSDTPATSDVLTYDGSNAVWTPALGTVGTRRFHISDANVAGTGRAIVLTSGHSLTALQDGDGISFTAQTTISGGQSAVTVAIDSIAAITIQHGGGDSITDTFGSGELRQNFLIDLIYSADSDRLVLVGTQSGSAVRFNVGDAEFNIPRLHAGGLLRLAWIPPLPAARITSGTFATARIADTAVTTAKLADANVTNAKIADDTIAEPKLNINNAPSTNDVLSWNGTEMIWAPATTPPPATHTSYTATGADATFTEAEFLAGTSGTGNSVNVADWTGALYAAFARPTSAGTITELYFYAQGAGRGNNQIGGWTVEAATLSISGEDHYVIRSNGALTFISGVSVAIEVA